MGKRRALAAILAVAGMGVGLVAGTPAWAEMPRRVSLGGTGSSVQEQSYLALRCLELAPGRGRMADLTAGWGRREAGVAEDSDGLPAPVYGFAFSNEDDDEPACGVKPARRADSGV